MGNPHWVALNTGTGALGVGKFEYIGRQVWPVPTDNLRYTVQ